MPYKDKLRQRQAQREWAARNKGIVSRNSNKTRKKHADRVSQHKDVPCEDCNVKYPHYVMDLDHLPGVDKVSSVSKLVGEGAAWKRIEEELKKCEVVCANCHRERTYQRISER